MAVYRFRVLFEDYEDVFRDIEVKSTQSFEDLHHAILQSIGFQDGQMASFYMSDDSWRKGKEITLVDMSEDDKRKGFIMSKSILADFIDDPHQKIIYIFDFLAMWTFYIELIKILPDEPKVIYPRVVKSVGTAPKQFKSQVLPTPGEDEEDLEPKTKKIFDEIGEEYGQDDHKDDDDLAEGFGEETEEGTQELGRTEEEF